MNPEKYRQVESERYGIGARNIRLWLGTGLYEKIVLVPNLIVGKVFHLGQLQRGVLVAFTQRGFENLLARVKRHIDRGQQPQLEPVQPHRAIQVQRIARIPIEQLVKVGLIVSEAGLVLSLLELRLGEVYF